MNISLYTSDRETNQHMESYQEDLLLQALKTVFNKNTSPEILSSELVEVKLPATRSNIIIDNDNSIYVAKIKNLEGLFVKEEENTRVIGRLICDLVKDKFQCKGFFTSDELPRYGITRTEVTEIFHSANKKKNDGDLLIFYAYDLPFATEANAFLASYLSDKIRQVIVEA